MYLYSIEKKNFVIYRIMDLKGNLWEPTQKSFDHRPMENQGLREPNCELSNWPFHGAA
jgi:hypothetical protein